jgi:hypothetical protein
MHPSLPEYQGNLSVVKIVSTKESIEQREDLVAGMEFDNAQGEFDKIGVDALEQRAQESAAGFVNAFSK